MNAIYIQRTNVMQLDTTDININYTSNHPNQHKMAAYRYLTNRMTSLPLTTDREKTEWQKILTIAKNNNFLVQLITRLKRHTQQKNAHRQFRKQNQEMGHLHVPQP